MRYRYHVYAVKSLICGIHPYSGVIPVIQSLPTNDFFHSPRKIWIFYSGKFRNKHISDQQQISLWHQKESHVRVMSYMILMTGCMMHAIVKSRLYEYMFERKRSFLLVFFFLNKQAFFISFRASMSENMHNVVFSPTISAKNRKSADMVAGD